MTYAQMTLPEFDREMATTRTLLERVPEDLLGWKATPKSNSIGWNANHLAEIPSWAANILVERFFDMRPVGGVPYESPKLTSRAEILALFDGNVSAGRVALAGVQDGALMDVWQLRDAGMVIVEMPRVAAFRTWVMSHSIHHRAILSAYFRMVGVPVPAIYGPSADAG